VPAKDEAAAIAHSLRSLLACDYPNLQIVAVDDRSTDATGRLMDEIAASPASNGRLRVLHVKKLPEGWMGKPHAMALAATGVTSDWLLFTDADVIFDPRAIRLAIQYAEQSHGDHMVLYPTLILHSVAEKMLIGFFQSVSALAARPWKIADPKATKDYIGVGAFNLIRRPVYEALGGYAELRMEVLEDMRLGFRAKREGYAQRVAFGKDLVRIRWAESAWGILNNLTKNLYSTFRFRTSLLLAACVGMFVMCLTPFVALFFPGPAQWAGTVTLVALLLLNLRYWRLTDIPPVYLALFPIATLLFVGTLLCSMILVLWRGGVLWRGTLYPLKELRRQAGPLW
jgi:cellulose synthase/poly-beta-1,6-N-acetylglucosamine synthase-like glycosyltransferase